MNTIRFILFLFACLGGHAFAAIDFYVSPPTIQTALDSGITGTTTDTFNTLTAGTSFTSFTSPTTGIIYSGTGTTVSNHSYYGGHNQGVYLSISSHNAVNLAMPGDMQYLGLQFTAGDAYNHIAFYSDGVLLYDFSTATLLSLLPKNSMVTAVNGTAYSTNSYYGQPSTGYDPNEAFAYLNFVASGETNFDQVVLYQTTNWFFELDNISVRGTTPTIPLSMVPVPEPSSMLLVLTSFMAACMGSRRRRQD